MALMLSGGIHDTYCLEFVEKGFPKKKEKLSCKCAKYLYDFYDENYKNPEQFIPDMNEFFDIVKYALDSGNIVACLQIEVSQS
jgi:hypothetical protein